MPTHSQPNHKHMNVSPLYSNTSLAGSQVGVVRVLVIELLEEDVALGLPHHSRLQALHSQLVVQGSQSPRTHTTAHLFGIVILWGCALVFYMPVFGFSGWVVFWRGRCSFGIRQVAQVDGRSQKEFLAFTLWPTQPPGLDHIIQHSYWIWVWIVAQAWIVSGGAYFYIFDDWFCVWKVCIPFMSLIAEWEIIWLAYI